MLNYFYSLYSFPPLLLFQFVLHSCGKTDTNIQDVTQLYGQYVRADFLLDSKSKFQNLGSLLAAILFE